MTRCRRILGQPSQRRATMPNTMEQRRLAPVWPSGISPLISLPTKMLRLPCQLTAASQVQSTCRSTNSRSSRLPQLSITAHSRTSPKDTQRYLPGSKPTATVLLAHIERFIYIPMPATWPSQPPRFSILWHKTDNACVATDPLSPGTTQLHGFAEGCWSGAIPFDEAHILPALQLRPSTGSGEPQYERQHGTLQPFVFGFSALRAEKPNTT